MYMLINMHQSANRLISTYAISGEYWEVRVKTECLHLRQAIWATAVVNDDWPYTNASSCCEISLH